MLIDADHAAFEDGEIAFGRVHSDFGSGRAVAIGIFFARMIDLAMVREFFAYLSILHAFIGHKMCFAGDVGAKDRRKVVFLDTLDVEGARAALALDESSRA